MKSTLLFLSSWTVFLKVLLIKSINILASFVLFTFFFLGVFDTSYFRFVLYLVVSRTNQNKNSTEFETTQLYLLIPCEGGPSYLIQRQLSRETYFQHQQYGIAIPLLNNRPLTQVGKNIYKAETSYQNLTLKEAFLWGQESSSINLGECSLRGDLNKGDI